jgi:hypothetical protein
MRLRLQPGLWDYNFNLCRQLARTTETGRIVDALLTQVYDKDWQWRSMGEPSFGGWKPVEAKDIAAGAVVEGGHWKATAYRVRHGDGLGFPPAFLQRWMCYGYRFEAEGKVVAISGDTVDCEGLAQLAHGADLLVHCWRSMGATWRAPRSKMTISATWCSTRWPAATRSAGLPRAPEPRHSL